MKYICGLFFMLLAQVAAAGQCRVDGGPWIDVFQNSITIDVNVRAAPGTGLIVLDGYLLECRYTPSGFPETATDYWRTNANALVPGLKFGSHKMGLRIGSNDYLVPVPAGIFVAQMSNHTYGVDLRTYVYLRTTGSPGSYVDIRAGDHIGTFRFKQTNNTMDPEANVEVQIRAANDLFFEPSTCTINDNMPIDVDFNQVDPTSISASPSDSPFQRVINLKYFCPDQDVSSAITITFRGAPASFSSDVLATSNPDLGVALLRGPVLVRPGRSFTTSIFQSIGSNDVTFVLIRKAGSLPVAGPFTASATLVMGVP